MVAHFRHPSADGRLLVARVRWNRQLTTVFPPDAGIAGRGNRRGCLSNRATTHPPLERLHEALIPGAGRSVSTCRRGGRDKWRAWPKASTVPLARSTVGPAHQRCCQRFARVRHSIGPHRFGVELLKAQPTRRSKAGLEQESPSLDCWSMKSCCQRLDAVNEIDATEEIDLRTRCEECQPLRRCAPRGHTDQCPRDARLLRRLA